MKYCSNLNRNTLLQTGSLGPDADVLQYVKTEASISSSGHHSANMSPTDEICNLSALQK